MAVTDSRGRRDSKRHDTADSRGIADAFCSVVCHIFPAVAVVELTGGNSGTPTWHKMMEIVQNKNAIWVNRERTPQFRNR